MRILQYVGTSLRDIKTQPLRCFLTLSAVALSSALLVTLATIGITTRDAIISHFQQGDTLSKIIVSANSSAGGGFFSSNIQKTQTNAEKLTDDVVEQIAALEGVKAIAPQASIWELKNFTLDGSAPYVANVVATSNRSVGRAPLSAGTWFENDDTTANVVLGYGYLRALGIKDPQSVIGKTITFTTVAGYRGVGADIPAWNANETARESFNNTKRTQLTATIVGVSTPSVSDNQIFIPLSWGHQVETVRNDTPTGETTSDSLAKNGYTSIVVDATSQAEVAPLSTRINALGFGTTTYQRQIDQINQLSTILWIVLGAVALISLISASLGIINTLLMSISEQRHTIRIWRACGASRKMISRLYVLQAIILSFVGACLGAAAGVACCIVINSRIETVLAAQGLDSITLPNFSLPIVAASILISIVIALLAALYPARVASRRLID